MGALQSFIIQHKKEKNFYFKDFSSRLLFIKQRWLNSRNREKFCFMLIILIVGQAANRCSTETS